LTIPCSFIIFFFSSRRRHTRSKRDWSSDVCSSDLAAHVVHRRGHRGLYPRIRSRGVQGQAAPAADADYAYSLRLHVLPHAQIVRSEERRVGKECRAWWSTDQ